jgi:spore coat polysaccharide biosynthesis protein SpsF
MVQARMSSSRFPGKVLAPLGGQPLIAHVFSRICEAVPKERVVLVTSEDASDDPLVAYVGGALGMAVFRGSLEDVAGRFRACLRVHPCEWFVRICGDSPAIDPGLLGWMLDRVSDDLDLLTNVAERTFPPGQSVEIVRVRTFLRWITDELTPEEREHVTLHFYRNSELYRIRNVSSADASLSARRMVVDTLEDLRTLERILAADPGLTRGYADHARLGEVTTGRIRET